MKHITKRSFSQLQAWHIMVLLSLLTLALLDQMPDSQAGWITCPPQLVSLTTAQPGRRRRNPRISVCDRLQGMWRYTSRSWSQPLLRSLLLAGLWLLGGRRGPSVVIIWPWLLWLWQVAAAGWPELGHQSVWHGGHWLLWQGQRLLVVGYLGLALGQVKVAAGEEAASQVPGHGLLLGLACQRCGQEEARVEVSQCEDGGYQATLCGHFTVQVSGEDPVRARLLMLFLRLLDVPGQQRGSRRTRDGRMPFVRQTHLSEWFGLPQPDISRVEGYWLRGAWPELLSQSTAEILTPELVRRVATVCATFPQWGQEQVYRHLQGQGVAVSQRQVRQAMEQSGWSTLRQELRRRYHWTAQAFHLREEWLVQELLRQVQRLQACLEKGQQPPVEEQIALGDVQMLLREVGVESTPPLKAIPWLLRIEQILFGNWQAVEGDTIRCPTCGSTHIVRKSRQPRMKRFYDAQGELQEIAVYRYYCRNSACARGSFTHLPPGLVPYSRHRLEVHLLAGQAYAWGHSTYRRVGQALHVSETTIYRWASAWGHNLLPVAAIFGVVRSSGVVGVDEKYVLVPKNDKPAAKMKRWMYVYLAAPVLDRQVQGRRLHLRPAAHRHLPPQHQRQCPDILAGLTGQGLPSACRGDRPETGLWARYRPGVPPGAAPRVPVSRRTGGQPLPAQDLGPQLRRTAPGGRRDTRSDGEDVPGADETDSPEALPGPSAPAERIRPARAFSPVGL